MGPVQDPRSPLALPDLEPPGKNPTARFYQDPFLRLLSSKKGESLGRQGQALDLGPGEAARGKDPPAPPSEVEFENPPSFRALPGENLEVPAQNPDRGTQAPGPLLEDRQGPSSAARHQGNPRFQDPRLLAGHPSQTLSQDVLVFPLHGGHHRDPGNHGVGGIEPSPQAGLQAGRLHARLVEEKEGRRREKVEEGRPRRVGKDPGRPPEEGSRRPGPKVGPSHTEPFLQSGQVGAQVYPCPQSSPLEQALQEEGGGSLPLGAGQVDGGSLSGLQAQAIQEPTNALQPQGQGSFSPLFQVGQEGQLLEDLLQFSPSLRGGGYNPPLVRKGFLLAGGEGPSPTRRNLEMSFHRSGPRLFLRVLLLGGLLFAGTVLPGCTTRLSAPPAPEHYSGLEKLELERVGDRYLHLAWSLHPSLAVWVGGTGTGVPRLKASREEIFAARKEARNLLDQVLAIRSAGLPPSGRRDQKILAGFLRGLLVELEKVEPWARDPGYYLDEIQACLALAGAPPDPTEQGETWRLQLLAIPHILVDSLDNLRFCPPLFLDQAARRARDLSKALRSGRLYPAEMEKGLAGEVRAAGERAGLALEAWAIRLEKRKIQKPGGSFVLGEDTLAALLREREGIYTPPSELAQDLRSRQKVLTARLAQALGDEPSPRLLLSVARKPLSPGKKGEIQDLSPSGALAFCRAKGIFPGAPPLPRSRPLASPLLKDLAIPVWIPPSSASPPTPDLLLKLARATWPGLRALQAWLGQNDSPLRRKAPSLLFCRGWLSYAEDLWAAKDPHPEVRILRAWRTLAECVQARAALDLHMGNLTLSQAEELLRGAAFLPRNLARDRALELARVPLRYLAYLGLQSIGELRRSCRTREGRNFLAGAFNGKVLSCGALPASAMEVEILFYCDRPGGK